jgi:hypothetical protein
VAAAGFTPCGAEVAEDIRNLQSGTLHDRSSWLLGRLPIGWCQQIERAGNLT